MRFANAPATALLDAVRAARASSGTLRLSGAYEALESDALGAALRAALHEALSADVRCVELPALSVCKRAFALLFDVLSEHPHVHRLRLPGAHVTRRVGVLMALHLAQLRNDRFFSLDLRKCPIGDGAAIVFARYVGRQLNLSDVLGNAEHVKALARAAPTCHLRSLNLNGCNIEHPQTLRALMDGLSSSPVESLSFRNAKMSNASCVELVSSLRRLPGLRRLVLSGIRQLSPASVLSELIASCEFLPFVHSLGLAGIGGVDANLLSLLLLRLPRLAALDLTDTRFSYTPDLLQSLRTHAMLRSLLLAGTDDAPSTLVAETLAGMRSLRRLELSRLQSAGSFWTKLNSRLRLPSSTLCWLDCERDLPTDVQAAMMRNAFRYRRLALCARVLLACSTFPERNQRSPFSSMPREVIEEILVRVTWS